MAIPAVCFSVCVPKMTVLRWRVLDREDQLNHPDVVALASSRSRGPTQLSSAGSIAIIESIVRNLLLLRPCQDGGIEFRRCASRCVVASPKDHYCRLHPQCRPPTSFAQ
jgi:hypothetical protein